MRRKKLGFFGIIIIIFAGFFQLISLSLDQAVIQIEDKYRVVQERNSKILEDQNSALSNNRKIGQIIRSASFQLFVLSSLNLRQQEQNVEIDLKSTKDHFYAKILMSHVIIIKDIFFDETNKSLLCQKFLDIKKNDKIEKVSFCDHFINIEKASYSISQSIVADPPVPVDYNYVQYLIRYNESYFNQLLEFFGKTENELTDQLYKINIELYNINQRKQLFLLFSMISQLLSFLFLLVLFRRILK